MPADAKPLAALAERTFRDTFADDNSPRDIEAYVRDAFSLDRLRAELSEDANTFLLAMTDAEELVDCSVSILDSVLEMVRRVGRAPLCSLCLCG